MLLACETDDNLVALREHWLPIFAANNDPGDLRANYRKVLIGFSISYAQLVALSIGMKRHGAGTENPFVMRCWHAACDVCSVMANEFNSPELCKDTKLVLSGPC